MIRKWMLCALALLALSGGVFAIGEVEPTPTPAPTQAPAEQDAEAGTAPPFTLLTYAGEDIALSDYRGSAVVLHFWASWEQASYTDAAILQALYEDYEESDFVVIGINHFDVLDDARAFVDDLDVSYITAPDPDGAVAIAYELENVPQTIIINPAGDIQARLEGAITRAQVLRELSDVITLQENQQQSTIDAPVPPDARDLYRGIPQSVNAAGYPVLGNPDALVVLENFSSFACPFCRDFHSRVFRQLVEEVRDGGDVAIVYVPIWTTGSVRNSRAANLAALCAAEQNQFWLYADMLFDWHTRFERSAFIDGRLRQGARNIGLDMTRWNACMNDERPLDVLDTALDELQERSYTGTPTIVVNGSRVRATLAAIMEAINRATGNQL